MATHKNQKRIGKGGGKKNSGKSAGRTLTPLKKNTGQKSKKPLPTASFAAKKSATVEKKPPAPKKSSYSKTLRTGILSSADVRQQLIEMGGENTIDIIREFDSDMTDEELARKTGMKASDVRVVLNRLHNLGLFAYTRMRDKDSGWYSYIWKMNENKLKEFSDTIENAGQGETAQNSDKEGYFCESCEQKKIVDFETAMDTQFKCSNCGSALSFFEGKRK